MSDHDYRDVLLKAASLVEEGWCQGNWYYLDNAYLCEYEECGSSHLVNDPMPEEVAEGRRPEKVCLEGAIRLAAYDLTDDPESLQFGASTQLVTDSDQKIAHLLGAPVEEIWEWNDADGRTADEVATALRKAADA